MKSRRVTVTLEIETDAPLKVLREKISWGFKRTMLNPRTGRGYVATVLQAQANVIRQGQGKR